MTTTEPAPAEAEERPIGYGRLLRKEDPRLIRGMGKFVDDVTLPGMLHMAILRSPVAHGRIVSIDKSAAEAHPKVVAVITGEDLAGHGLAWMPTLSNDVQAVLATDKVRFQHHEVAFIHGQITAGRCGRGLRVIDRYDDRIDVSQATTVRHSDLESQSRRNDDVQRRECRLTVSRAAQRNRHSAVISTHRLSR